MSHDCTLLDVIVVGAGQAGLAVAQQLAARDDLRIVVLEAGAEIGEVWRGRWDSLTLFTPAEYCSLPGLAFPASPGTYPTKARSRLPGAVRRALRPSSAVQHARARASFA